MAKRTSKYDILADYFYNESIHLENDVKQLQENIKWRRVSTIDCLELIIATERLSSFLEFSQNVKAILRIKDPDDDD